LVRVDNSNLRKPRRHGQTPGRGKQTGREVSCRARVCTAPWFLAESRNFWGKTDQIVHLEIRKNPIRFSRGSLRICVGYRSEICVGTYPTLRPTLIASSSFNAARLASARPNSKNMDMGKGDNDRAPRIDRDIKISPGHTSSG